MTNTIYLSHSTAFDFKKDLYQPITEFNKSWGYNLVLPHELSDEPYDTFESLKQNKIKIILAEVSFPSTGQGIELGWASFFNVPIVCLYKKTSRPSTSLKRVSDIFLEYDNILEVKERLKEYLSF